MTLQGNATRDGEVDTLLAAHRAGDLDRARAGYERLLASAPDDPNLLGLLGVVAVQQARSDQAESLLRRALRAPIADPAIHLRNLNNLFALLKQERRDDAARELARMEVPHWPLAAAPDDRDRTTLLSVARALAVYGQPNRAIGLLDGAMTHLGDDPEALELAGRLHLRGDDPAAALPPLQRACERDPSNWSPLAALGVAHAELGNAAAAREAAKRSIRAARLYSAPRQKGEKATILVLQDTPTGVGDGDSTLHDLHFSKNYISQASRVLAGEFRFASIFADLPGGVDDLPQVDLVFNNMASGERMSAPGRLEQAEALIDRIGRPVINHPRATAQMTRQKVADLLEGIPGLKVPRIERYWRDMDRFGDIEASIASAFAYPVIIRHVAADQSSKSLLSDEKTAHLVRDRGELHDFLGKVDWPQFYAIEYVDLRKSDGNFRKLRAAFFPDEIVIVSGAHYEEWMVGGWRAVAEGRAFYEAFPHLIDEMNRTLLEPEAILGPQITPVLEAIRKRVPLDVFGMDFDVDGAGEIVLFEAGATMNFHPRRNPLAHHRFPEQPARRIDDAFRRLVRRRAGE